jgi:hypothetical protein
MKKSKNNIKGIIRIFLKIPFKLMINLKAISENNLPKRPIPILLNLPQHQMT